MGLNRDFDDDLPPLGIQRRYSSPQPVPADRLMIERFVNPLDDSPDMNVNGSVTPVTFRAVCPPNYNGMILSAQFFICDTGIRPSRFGALAELANGCMFTFRNGSDDSVMALGGVQPAICTVISYKKNSDWVRSCGTNINFWFGNGNDDLLTWDFPFHEWGIGIQIVPGDYVEMVVNDDLTLLGDFQGSLNVRLIGPPPS